jgi:hypothetical protein
MKRIFIFVPLLFLSCRLFPERVSMDDPRIQPLLTAASSFDRILNGFSPLPKTADVDLEWSRGGRYDAMLHIYAKTSRTIAFRRIKGGYKWIGEQEIFEGPRQHKTPDGTFSEQIVLTYDIENVSGYPMNRLNVSYDGEDPRLANRWNLTLDDAKPVLREWGY